MDMKLFVTVFATVFLAEIGDKTQLATLLYATDAKNSKWLVFAAAALALVITSAIGVIAGSFLSQHINPKYLNYLAGAGFIAIGVWTLARA